MEHLWLEYFKDKPAVLNAYFRYKIVLLNLGVLVMLCVAMLAKTDLVRSLSLGMVTGIVLISLGQSVHSLKSKDSSNKSVNG